MLASLAIRDVVLIEKLDLSFDAGLAVLTGETGAGKSILLDSLGLALGQRAEAGLVRVNDDDVEPGVGHLQVSRGPQSAEARTDNEDIGIKVDRR